MPIYSLDHVNDPMLTLAMGYNPLISECSYINKWGRRTNIDTTTDPADIWGGNTQLWVPPTAARIHNVASDNVADVGSVLSSGVATGGSISTIVDSGATFSSDGVAVGDTVLDDTNMEHATVVSVTETTITTHVTRHGKPFNSGDTYRVVTATSTGASVVHIYGLNSLMIKVEEFVVMNGTTNVATLLSYYRINRAHIDGAAGRTTSNIGAISGTAVTDGTQTFNIAAGFGSTTLAIYTVSAGETACMTRLYAHLNKSNSITATMSLRETAFASIDGAGSRVDDFFSISDTRALTDNPKPYRNFEEHTDIWIRCDEVSANDADITAGFDLILVTNR